MFTLISMWVFGVAFEAYGKYAIAIHKHTSLIYDLFNSYIYLHFPWLVANTHTNTWPSYIIKQIMFLFCSLMRMRKNGYIKK